MRTCICLAAVVVALLAGADATEGDAQPSWIWYPGGNPTHDAPTEAIYVRKVVPLPEGTTHVAIRAVVDNRCQVYMNGQLVGEHGGWTQWGDFDATPAFKAGENVVAVVADNLGGPAGLWLDVRAELVDGTALRFPSDATWRCSKTEQPGWMLPGFDETGWVNAVALGPIPLPPWGDSEMEKRITRGHRRVAGGQRPRAADHRQLGG